MMKKMNLKNPVLLTFRKRGLPYHGQKVETNQGKTYADPNLLTIAAAIWGFAFAAQSTAMDYIGPFTLNKEKTCNRDENNINRRYKARFPHRCIFDAKLL